MASDDLDILLHRLRNALAAVEVTHSLRGRAARPSDDLADTLLSSAEELAAVADQIAETVRRAATHEHV